MDIVNGTEAVNFTTVSCEKFTTTFDNEGYIENVEPTEPPSNEIWYTSFDGQVVSGFSSLCPGAGSLISNTYENGKGIAKYSKNVTFLMTAGTNSPISGGKVLTLTLPSSLTSIYTFALRGCSHLKSVNIPSSVTTIGQQAFESCGSLTSITIPSSVTSIYSDVFNGCYFTSSNFINQTSYEGDFNATIVDSETSDGLLIKNGSIVKCRPLATDITIPSSITSVPSALCNGYSYLTSVTINSSVTSIGYGAFQNCSSLTSVYVNATTPPTLDYSAGYPGAFDGNAEGRKIYVPAASLSAYQSATNWSSYASDIEAQS